MTKMKPILFSTPMVNAILDGRKTVTRRMVKSQPNIIRWNSIVLNGYGGYCDEHGNPVKCRFTIGDVLWVRETWQYTDESINIEPGYVYKATDPDWDTMDGWKWRPSIFMPRDACRIFLEITDIRVERLQDITDEEAVREGIESFRPVPGDGPAQTLYKHYLKDKWGPSPIHSFQTLWQKINGPTSWEANDWVWVVRFKRIDKPQNF